MAKNGRRSPAGRAFTLVEMLVVIAIIAVVTTAAVYTFGRQKPRARLDSVALDLRSLLLGARQEALATGSSVVVLFFPDQVVPNGRGRVVVVEDTAGDFFAAATALRFSTFDPAAPHAPAGGELVEVVDLPAPVTLGPLDGLSSTPLPAPLVIDVSSDCGFCSTGTGRRGAIRFDSTGRATFHDADGPPLDRPVGASLSITASDTPGEVRTLAVASLTGTVLSVSGQR